MASRPETARRAERVHKFGPRFDNGRRHHLPAARRQAHAIPLDVLALPPGWRDASCVWHLSWPSHAGGVCDGSRVAPIIPSVGRTAVFNDRGSAANLTTNLTSSRSNSRPIWSPADLPVLGHCRDCPYQLRPMVYNSAFGRMAVTFAMRFDSP